MPWTAEEFKKFKADLTDAEASVAARQANAVLRACLADDGKQEDYERIAIATALKRISEERKRTYTMPKYTETNSMANVYIQSSDKPVKAKRLENGLLYLEEIALTKGKVYEYGARKELLPEEQVLSAKFLAECVGLPITHDHPKSDMMVNSQNIDNVICGLTGSNVRIIDRRPVVDGYVWDAKLIKAIEEGQDEVSIGYLANVREQVGEHEGERYEAVQEVIGLNHVALGLARGQGRCGRECIVMAYEDSLSEAKRIMEEAITMHRKHIEEPGTATPESQNEMLAMMLSAYDALLRHIESMVMSKGDTMLKANQIIPGSHEDKREKLTMALKAKYPEYESDNFPLYICAVFDDRVIFENWKSKEYYEMPYTIDEKGAIGLGEAVKGSLQFVKEVSPTIEGASGQMPASAALVGQSKQRGESKMELNLQGWKLNLETAKPEDVKAFQKSLDSLSNEYADLVSRARTQETLNAKLEAKSAVIDSLESKCKAFEERVHALESGKGLEALVSEKIELIRQAEARINGYQFAGKSNTQIMVDIVKSISPKFDEKGKSEQTIREVYNALMEHEAALGGPNVLKSIQVSAEAPKRDLQAELAEWNNKIKGRSAVKSK